MCRRARDGSPPSPGGPSPALINWGAGLDQGVREVGGDVVRYRGSVEHYEGSRLGLIDPGIDRAVGTVRCLAFGEVETLGAPALWHGARRGGVDQSLRDLCEPDGEDYQPHPAFR